MLSNEIHTARLLTIFQHAVGVCIRSLSVRGRVCPTGCLPGECLPRGCLPGGDVYLGGCLPGGGGFAKHTCRGQTDTCENVTFANFVCWR